MRWATLQSMADSEAGASPSTLPEAYGRSLATLGVATLSALEGFEAAGVDPPPATGDSPSVVLRPPVHYSKAERRA